MKRDHYCPWLSLAGVVACSKIRSEVHAFIDSGLAAHLVFIAGHPNNLARCTMEPNPTPSDPRPSDPQPQPPLPEVPPGPEPASNPTPQPEVPPNLPNQPGLPTRAQSAIAWFVAPTIVSEKLTPQKASKTKNSTALT
jgi:hypothetical protein